MKLFRSLSAIVATLGVFLALPTVAHAASTPSPSCVVSLSPSATETLFAIGAGSQVKAVDQDANFPTTGLPNLRVDAFNPSTEALASICPTSKAHPSATPDLVVISYDANSIKEGLTALGVKVVEQDAPNTLADALGEIRALGQLTGHVAAANALASKIQGQIATDVKSISTMKKAHPLKNLSVYYELDPTYYSLTSDTFVGSLLKSLGVTNVADAAASPTDYGYPQLTAEYLIGASPKLILLADTKCCAINATVVKGRAGWSTMASVRSGHLVGLDDDVASRWGPRLSLLMNQLTAAVKATELDPKAWK